MGESARERFGFKCLFGVSLIRGYLLSSIPHRKRQQQVSEPLSATALTVRLKSAAESRASLDPV